MMAGLMSSDGSGNDYFFDVEFSENHDLENTITQNPVMTGVSVNDHVYRQPVVLTLDVATSDCFTTNNGTLVSGSTRSVAAFEALTSLWQNATLVDVYVGLNIYQGMVIRSVNVKRDKTLMHAMRATVVLQELMVVGEAAISISSDPSTTDSTNGGTKNPDSVGSELAGQFSTALAPGAK